MSNEVIHSLPSWVTECQTYHGELSYAEDNPEPKVLSDDEKLEIILDVRDLLLNRTDWIFTLDSPVSDSDKALWSTYRQSLRDLTSQSGFYWDGVYNYTNWPQPPYSNIIYEPELDSNLFDQFT